MRATSTNKKGESVVEYIDKLVPLHEPNTY